MVRIDIKRTDFYNELPPEKQKEYFETTNFKFLPNVDNIYYTVSIKGDFNGNKQLEPFFERLNELRREARQTHEPQQYNSILYVNVLSSSIYKYCLTCPDLYDIFITDYLPNEETPRIEVQIRSYGLWVEGWEEMLLQSYIEVEGVLFEQGCVVNQVRENRIDYCYHTNAIKTPEKLFRDRHIGETMKTQLTRYHATGRLTGGKYNLKKDYFALGERRSNYVFIRFYNKALEVIENGYKGYFFDIWYKSGIINFYDKYCLEYAYKEKNFDRIHRAKLRFYLAYGTSASVRREFELALNDVKCSASYIKGLAEAYMPEVTTVFNIELETKRKFYYLSDAIIEKLGTFERSEKNEGLLRMYKILDNRELFLNFITDSTVKFVKRDDTYCDWWERLRRVKMDCIKPDGKLLRDYSNNLDHGLMQRRFINSVAGNAVYMDNLKSGFREDLSDLLSLINDNDKYSIHLAYYSSDGELKNDIDSDLIKDYRMKKDAREIRIRNRKKKADANANPSQMEYTVFDENIKPLDELTAEPKDDGGDVS